jgi:hypothetical protein
MIDPTKVVADWEQDYKIMQDQRAEIARLRLTDEEREAIEKAISRELDCDWYGGPEPARVVTLRGMLERTK